MAFIALGISAYRYTYICARELYTKKHEIITILLRPEVSSFLMGGSLQSVFTPLTAGGIKFIIPELFELLTRRRVTAFAYIHV